MLPPSNGQLLLEGTTWHICNLPEGKYLDTRSNKVAIQGNWHSNEPIKTILLQDFGDITWIHVISKWTQI